MKTQNRKRGLTENETKPGSSTEDTVADVFNEMYRDMNHSFAFVFNAT
jgi:hypothetical protein